jgi:hypothetical protein
MNCNSVKYLKLLHVAFIFLFSIDSHVYWAQITSLALTLNLILTLNLTLILNLTLTLAYICLSTDGHTICRAFTDEKSGQSKWSVCSPHLIYGKSVLLSKCMIKPMGVSSRCHKCLVITWFMCAGSSQTTPSPLWCVRVLSHLSHCFHYDREYRSMCCVSSVLSKPHLLARYVILRRKL